MDVIIKSFNRPYYLERCLHSIYQHLSGDFNIIILDDGTPQPYLDKIQKLFSGIRIVKSAYYKKKSEALMAHLSGRKYDISVIPVSSWKNYIEKTSDIFLLLEEDAWLTGSVNLESVHDIMKKDDIVTLKLFWAGNPGIVKGEKTSLNEDVENINPELPVNSHLISNLLLNDRLRMRSLLVKAGLISDQWILPYYTLYTVASAFFIKEYWLEVWRDSEPKVNEGYHLANALQWMIQNKKSRYAKTKEEKINTSYTTSAVNSFRTIDFDFIWFNRIMNEAWLNGDLDPLENFPKDFSVEYLESFLAAANVQYCSPTQWHEWIRAFKNQYRNLGCVID